MRTIKLILIKTLKGTSLVTTFCPPTLWSLRPAVCYTGRVMLHSDGQWCHQFLLFQHTSPLTSSKSLLSDAMAQPQCRFWATNGIGEGVRCSNSSLLKSKQGVFSHDKAQFLDESVPFWSRLRELDAFFFFFFFSFFISWAVGTNVLWGWGVLSTRTAGADLLNCREQMYLFRNHTQSYLLST